MYPQPINRLVSELSKLPGIGHPGDVAAQTPQDAEIRVLTLR
jgi:recombinational DNA repair protein RecR